MPAMVVTLLLASSLLVVACGGSDKETQTASGGSPASAPGNGQGGDLVEPEAAKAINNPRPADRCTNQLSNEEICSDYSNYLLSFLPIKDDSDFATRGPYLGGGSASKIEIEAVEEGQDNDGQARAYEKGPATFGELLQVDFDDDGDIGNSGSVRIAARAGDVNFGTVHFWLRNEDGAADNNESAFCEKQRGGGGGPMFLSCGAPNNATQGVQQCSDNGNDEECGFSFYLQNYPVRVGVSNRIGGSELLVNSVSSQQPSGVSDRYDFLRSDAATTLQKGEKVVPGKGSLWLAGFRAVAGAQIRVEARLKAADEAGESAGWADAPVYMTATFVKAGEKEVTPVCRVDNGSTGTSGKCSVDITNGSVSQPGTVKFDLYT